MPFRPVSSSLSRVGLPLLFILQISILPSLVITSHLMSSISRRRTTTRNGLLSSPSRLSAPCEFSLAPSRSRRNYWRDRKALHVRAQQGVLSRPSRQLHARLSTMTTRISKSSRRTTTCVRCDRFASLFFRAVIYRFSYTE